MNRLIARIGHADLRQHPLQTGLAMLGVAIAVAVVVAVDLANHSAREAMRVSLESVTGSATHQIVAGPQGVDERVYTRLRTELGIRRAAPVVQGGVVEAGEGGRSLTLLGVDAFAEGPFERPLGAAGDLGDAFNPLMLRDDAVVVGAQEAERLGVEAGGTLELRINGVRKTVTVVAVVDDPADQSRGLLLTDIAAAQNLLDQFGRLDRIDLIVPGAQASALSERLGEGVRVVPAAASAASVLEMSRAFQINLTALSLLAVVVGAFLVFNTLSFLGVRRRPSIGVLRAMGVQRGEIRAQMIGDALLIGAVGTLAGLALGFALAHGLVGLVLQTVNDVYFARAAGELVLSPWSLGAGIAVGLVGSVVAALAPAQDAAATPPRAALSRADLEQRARRLARRGGWSGVGVVLAGALVIVASDGLVPAFVGLFALILGSAFLAPAIILGIGALLRGLTRGRPIAGLIVEGAVASLSRTGVAVAALSVAVAAVIGVAVMIASFRGSVIDWLEGSLAADFYISAPAALSDAQADRLAAVGGVDFVSRSQWTDLATDDGPVTLWALGLPGGQSPQIQTQAPAREPALDAFEADRAVLVSEPFAARRSLAPGDSLSLPVGGATVAFEVAGIYRDYASPTGAVLMRRELYQSLYNDPGLAGIGVHATPAGDRDTLINRLESALSGVPGARVTDNAAVFEQSLRIFDRTFAITEVLRWLAGLVAFVGVISALMALQLDRLREFAVLRAVGLSRGGLAGVITGQSGLLGLIAGLWAVPLGVALAALLVFVINRRAFGWTMGFELQAGPVFEGVLLAVIAALLATGYPAWRATRLRIAAALKGE